MQKVKELCTATNCITFNIKEYLRPKNLKIQSDTILQLKKLLEYHKLKEFTTDCYAGEGDI